MPHKRTKVLVGLSGGVDSAVAAMLLVEQGYAVTGVTMAVYGAAPLLKGAANSNACYGPGEAEDIEHAREAAGTLGIAHHVVDCVAGYSRHVLGYFRATYLAGRTPNPCVRCNQLIKFGMLPALAAKQGLEWDFFATGHYVRTGYLPGIRNPVLMRGADVRRDQSYFLYRLGASQIRRAMFPLGGYTKEHVRTLAKTAGLPMHDAPDSQDFYAGDYRELLAVQAREGDIVNTKGDVLGRHQGYWNFTPGQRRGLGFSAEKPLYVVRVDALRNEVVVGSREETGSLAFIVDDVCLSGPLEDFAGHISARVRSSCEPSAVTVKKSVHGLEVTFDEPQEGVAPGQSLVFYHRDAVLGGGVVREACSRHSQDSSCHCS